MYKDVVSSFEELLAKYESFSVHERNIQTLAIELYKVAFNLSPKIKNFIFPLETQPHYAGESVFKTFNVKTVSWGNWNACPPRPPNLVIDSKWHEKIFIVKIHQKNENEELKNVLADCVKHMSMALVLWPLVPNPASKTILLLSYFNIYVFIMLFSFCYFECFYANILFIY